jgi:hypothetical protein
MRASRLSWQSGKVSRPGWLLASPLPPVLLLARLNCGLGMLLLLELSRASHRAVPPGPLLLLLIPPPMLPLVSVPLRPEGPLLGPFGTRRAVGEEAPSPLLKALGLPGARFGDSSMDARLPSLALGESADGA